VQAVHVSNQHLLTMTHPDRTSSVVGGYMIFYSLGSALGAITTTTVFAGAGWTGCSILGAAFAACALVVWASSRRAATNPSLGRDGQDMTTSVSRQSAQETTMPPSRSGPRTPPRAAT